jgi:hypothetical protein
MVDFVERWGHVQQQQNYTFVIVNSDKNVILNFKQGRFGTAEAFICWLERFF